jgi:large conductance mechanosensitive channel
MKKFFAEFKKFITRGNVVDMAVGVIVGSSFTAIVNGLSNNILKPLINWLLATLFGADSLSELFTFLKRVDMQQDILNEAGEVIGSETVPDLTQSIYIDWGAFINAVINFFLIALVLFTLVKIINGIRASQEQWTEEIKRKRPTREERREMKALGIRRRDKEAVAAYYADKKAKAEEARLAAERAAAEKAEADRLAHPTVEELLGKILRCLEQK